MREMLYLDKEAMVCCY